MQINSFDDLAQDKERPYFGKTTAIKFQRLKIMIIGLESVGVEIAKNLIQMQPEVLTLCDQNITSISDLDHNSSVREDQIGKLSRAQACEKMLNEMFTSQTSVVVFDFNINSYFDSLRKNNNKQLPEQLLQQIDKHDIIVVADVLSRSFVIEISRRLRDNCQNATNKRFNQGLIWCGTLGLYSYLYEDFGPIFKIIDQDGQPAFPYSIESISKSDPGIVKILKDKPHSFQTGDFVTIQDVEGMTELNGNFPRPIRVISQYEFSIEDTSQLPNYAKGGLVYHAKVPFKVKFTSLEEQLNCPTFEKVSFFSPNNPKSIAKALTGHSTMLSISRILESQYECSEKEICTNSEEIFNQTKQRLLDQRQQNIDSMLQKDNTVTLNFTVQNHENIDWEEVKFDGGLTLTLVKDFKQKLFPFVTFLGGIAALECVKFSGKYTPMHVGPLVIDLYSQFNLKPSQVSPIVPRYNNQVHIFGSEMLEKLAKLSILLVGMGGSGCEFLRVLTMMGVAQNPDARITLVDDDLVHPFNLKDHFWFSQQALKLPKTQIAQKRAWEINQNINLDVIPIRITGKQELPSEFELRSLNVVISSFSTNAGRKQLSKIVNSLKIPLLDQTEPQQCEIKNSYLSQRINIGKSCRIRIKGNFRFFERNICKFSIFANAFFCLGKGIIQSTISMY